MALIGESLTLGRNGCCIDRIDQSSEPYYCAYSQALDPGCEASKNSVV